jgi:hypothetical protein
MSDEIAQKVGRGGAGNYYTKAEVENASHAVWLMCSALMRPFANMLLQSPPSQKSTQRVDTQLEFPTYARTGRGGAGNYIAPAQELPTSSDAQSDLQSAREVLDASREKLKDKVTVDKSKAYRGHSGRGGAGNWKPGSEEAERKRAEDKEMKVRNRIDASIRLDVEKELKPPPKVYAAPENTFGRS